MPYRRLNQMSDASSRRPGIRLLTPRAPSRRAVRGAKAVQGVDEHVADTPPGAVAGLVDQIQRRLRTDLGQPPGDVDGAGEVEPPVYEHTWDAGESGHARHQLAVGEPAVVCPVVSDEPGEGHPER